MIAHASTKEWAVGTHKRWTRSAVESKLRIPGVVARFVHPDDEDDVERHDLRPRECDGQPTSDGGTRRDGHPATGIGPTGDTSRQLVAPRGRRAGLDRSPLGCSAAVTVPRAGSVFVDAQRSWRSPTRPPDTPRSTAQERPCKSTSFVAPSPRDAATKSAQAPLSPSEGAPERRLMVGSAARRDAHRLECRSAPRRACPNRVCGGYGGGHQSDSNRSPGG